LPRGRDGNVNLRDGSLNAVFSFLFVSPPSRRVTAVHRRRILKSRRLSSPGRRSSSLDGRCCVSSSGDRFGGDRFPKWRVYADRIDDKGRSLIRCGKRHETAIETLKTPPREARPATYRFPSFLAKRRMIARWRQRTGALPLARFHVRLESGEFRGQGACAGNKIACDSPLRPPSPATSCRLVTEPVGVDRSDREEEEEGGRTGRQAGVNKGASSYTGDTTGWREVALAADGAERPRARNLRTSSSIASVLSESRRCNARAQLPRTVRARRKGSGVPERAYDR